MRESATPQVVELSTNQEATLHSQRDHQEEERVLEGIGGQVVIGQTLLDVRIWGKGKSHSR